MPVGRRVPNQVANTQSVGGRSLYSRHPASSGALLPSHRTGIGDKPMAR
jgi:hypothetical protein